MGWVKNTKTSRPDLRVPIWGYGCDGSLVLICLVEDSDPQTKWEIDTLQSWCILHTSDYFDAGDLLPLKFFTHLRSFDPTSKERPVAPNLHVKSS